MTGVQTCALPIYIMATLDAQAEKHGDIETYLITSDLDALQILDQNTYLYALKKGLTNIDKFDIAEFERRYGIRIDQFLDLKSLKGDSSDNIPGVPGVGEKTAVQLLQQFDTLDGVYKNLDQLKESTRKKLELGKESAYMSKKLAQLFTDAPVKLDLSAMDVNKFNVDKLRLLLEKLEFRSLLNNLPQYIKGDLDKTATQDELKPVREVDQNSIMSTVDAESVVLCVPDGDDFWLSVKQGTAAKFSISEATKILSKTSVVGHAVKKWLKVLLAHDDTLTLTVAHDTAQGSFLLNPLKKFHDLADLIGVESDQLTDPKIALTALWTIYEKQKQEFSQLPQLKKVAYEMDFPLIPILAKMEHRGIKLDIEKLNTMQVAVQQEILALQREIFELVGYEFNVGSPTQLAEALFTKLQLPTTGIKKGKTGYSTGQKELDKLRGRHPIIELVERFRELTKLQNTYIMALPKQVDNNGYIHTTFNQDIVATGRLSSTDPNLQNIPIRTELGRRIRDAFVPASGNVFVNADYSQFELRLAAVMASETEMIADFNTDIDIHAKTAAEILRCLNRSSYARATTTV